MSKEEILKELMELKTTLELPVDEFRKKTGIYSPVSDALPERIGYARGVIERILREEKKHVSISKSSHDH